MNFGTLADGLDSSPFDYEALPPQSDSRDVVGGIRSLIGFGKLVGPLVHSELYHRHKSHEASPKAISRRTGYN